MERKCSESNCAEGNSRNEGDGAENAGDHLTKSVELRLALRSTRRTRRWGFERRCATR